LKDGLKSLMRYLKNNFMDGARQDAIDLFLGNYEVSSDLVSPFVSVERSIKLRIVSEAVLTDVMMCGWG
jgi:phosphatidylinositol 4-phosphatase